MTDQRQIAELPANQISTKRGFPVYRTNPSVPSTSGMPTRNRRFHVPGGKASMIVDNSTVEIKGLGGMGFWWEEEVDSTRFVKLFLDGIKQAAGFSLVSLLGRNHLPNLGTDRFGRLLRELLDRSFNTLGGFHQIMSQAV